MFEKVNPQHPDKVADRIAGAIVDYAYSIEENPKIAVEVLIGHDNCFLIIESSIDFNEDEKYEKLKKIVKRITNGTIKYFNLISEKQDTHLANNQDGKIRCGDNGIFKGVPLTEEEKELSKIARNIYGITKSDGKYILNNNKLIICQSNIDSEFAHKLYYQVFNSWNKELIINPLGDWTGGLNVDSGATNRKLGSDMAQSITGGGLHGKDLSKADVSVNIYAFLKAQETNKPVELFCAIGDEYIDGKPYEEIVEIARKFIDDLGGFEKFAEWGLF